MRIALAVIVFVRFGSEVSLYQSDSLSFLLLGTALFVFTSMMLVGYMAETAEALDMMNIEYALQHLDIKPQNLFLVRNHVKVADFGLVKDLQGMEGR